MQVSSQHEGDQAVAHARNLSRKKMERVVTLVKTRNELVETTQAGKYVIYALSDFDPELINCRLVLLSLSISLPLQQFFYIWGCKKGFEDGDFENAKLLRPAGSFYQASDNSLYFVDSECLGRMLVDFDRKDLLKNTLRKLLIHGKGLSSFAHMVSSQHDGRQEVSRACDFSRLKKWREQLLVEEAASQLQAEVGGDLSGIPMKKMGRGIVNRMSCGQEVQRLCASAVDSLDKILLSRMTTRQDQLHVGQDAKTLAANVDKTTLLFEDIGATSVTLVLVDLPSSYSATGDVVCCSVWHWKADDQDEDYKSTDPTCILSPPQMTRFFLSELTPSSEYIFKVVCFEGSSRELSSWETRVATTASSDDDDDDDDGKDVDVKTVAVSSKGLSHFENAACLATAC